MSPPLIVERFPFRVAGLRLVGECRLELIQLCDGRTLVIATELIDNPGRSITNAAEEVATAACGAFGIDPTSLVWVEHYGYAGTANASGVRTFDAVSFATVQPERHRMFGGPSWRVMRDEDWRALGLPPRSPVRYRADETRSR